MTALPLRRVPTVSADVRIRVCWIELAILCAAFAIQIPLILNSDLGWLLTVCEKMLAGGKLGVDIIELNPPLSVLMYMPAAYLGSVLPVSPQIVVIAMVLAVTWWSTNLNLLTMQPLFADVRERRHARIVLLIVLALVPGATFGQREHIAVLAMLPFISLIASQAMAAPPPPLTLRIIAGLAAGFAMCIKPHFALLAALPILWNAVRQTTLRPIMQLECWAAAAVVVLYYGAALLTYPEYFSVYPRWAALTYLPLRKPLGFFFGADFLCSLGGLALMLKATCGNDRAAWQRAAPWLLAALGGYLSYLIQGKGFAYMRLPAATFALLASLLSPVVIGADAWQAGHARRLRMIVLSALTMVIWLVPARNSFEVLQEPIRAAAPAHPIMLAIGSNVGLGEPLVRKLDGSWASPAGSQLLSGGAMAMLAKGHLDTEQAAMAQDIVTMERDRLRRDLQLRRPDVLLIDSERFDKPFDWDGWARADPAIDREIALHYRLLTRRQGVAIWLRHQAP